MMYIERNKEQRIRNLAARCVEVRNQMLSDDIDYEKFNELKKAQSDIESDIAYLVLIIAGYEFNNDDCMWKKVY